jgi:CspA family cold shock protein
MSTGKVKWFNKTKGFGFIGPNDGSNDVFVHISEVLKTGQNDLKENQEVEYELVENKGKFAAGNLKILD